VLVASGWLAGPALATDHDDDPDPATTTVEDTTSTTDEVHDDTDPASETSTSTTSTSTSTTAATTTTSEPVVTTRPPATTTTTEANPLLVAGPSDGRRQITPDPVDDAPDATLVEQPAQTPPADDAERVIRRVVLALVAVAVLLTALAVYYWWITRPGEVEPEEPDEPGGDDTVDPWLTDSTSTR
jgi:hypothetical protein